MKEIISTEFSFFTKKYFKIKSFIKSSFKNLENMVQEFKNYLNSYTTRCYICTILIVKRGSN